MGQNIAILFILFFSAVICRAQSDTAALFESEIVKVTSGYLQGAYDAENDLKHFWGIPYAQAPIGNLRWREPQKTKPWKGIRQATEFGPRVMQKFIFDDMRFRSDTLSENGLYLNVWTPAKTPDEDLSVLVYFYGGGFVAGDGSEWRYDGASMAKKNIVVVTVNYRLGIFGFFAHPDLTAESPHKASGNYGLLDQQAAIQWVYDNISAFGGNPKKITIGGESAGSMSVFAQMASPLSKNLIAGGIGESGAIVPPTSDPLSLKEAEKQGQKIAERLGAKSIKELRNMPAQKLLDQVSELNELSFRPIIDGYFFEESPLETFKEGNQAQVPLLVGWNSTESAYAGFMNGKTPSPEQYKTQIKVEFGKLSSKAIELFPGNTEDEVISSATFFASNKFISQGSWKWSELHRQTGNSEVYRYLFEKPRPVEVNKTENQDNNGMPKPLEGAGHSWEIEYALGNLSTNKAYAWTPEDFKVSATMFSYFANFIKTGNPNTAELPRWEANGPNRPVKVMHIDTESQLKEEKNREQFEFLDQIWTKNQMN